MITPQLYQTIKHITNNISSIKCVHGLGEDVYWLNTGNGPSLPSLTLDYWFDKEEDYITELYSGLGNLSWRNTYQVFKLYRFIKNNH